MVVRIASIILTLAGLLALILGLAFWHGAALNMLALHMLLGFLTVACLWVIAIAQAVAKSGSWTMATVAIVLGGITAYLGMIQATLMVGPNHWIIQVVHLILGLLTIGLGHMLAARYRRNNPT